MTMDNAKLEHELKTYFRCEAEAAAPAQDWWQSAVSSATNTGQEPPISKQKTGLAAWGRNLVEILHINPQKPVWGIATYLLLLVLFAGLSAGLTDIVSNFPASGGAQPPITTGTLPPGTTGPSPTGTVPPGTTQPPITITNTTVTLTTPASTMLSHGLLFILIFSLFVLMTFVVLTWRWRVERRNSL